MQDIWFNSLPPWLWQRNVPKSWRQRINKRWGFTFIWNVVRRSGVKQVTFPQVRGRFLLGCAQARLDLMMDLRPRREEITLTNYHKTLLMAETWFMAAGERLHSGLKMETIGQHSRKELGKMSVVYAVMLKMRSPHGPRITVFPPGRTRANNQILFDRCVLFWWCCSAMS